MERKEADTIGTVIMMAIRLLETGEVSEWSDILNACELDTDEALAGAVSVICALALSISQKEEKDPIQHLKELAWATHYTQSKFDSGEWNRDDYDPGPFGHSA